MASPLDRLRYYVRPSTTLSPQERVEAERLTEVGKACFRARVHEFVKTHSHEPLLMSYSSDTTPLQTVKQFQASAGDIVVHRRGRRHNDILIETLFVASKSDVVCSVTEPRRMQDKTISKHLAAMLDNAKTLRSLGATDICLQRGVWDGALAKPMAERLAQVVSADLAQVTSAMSIGQRKMMELMTWTEGTGCMGRNVHVGFGSAMQLKLLSPEIPNNCYIAIESLRNTYADIAKYLPMWVPTVLEYRDWDFPDARVF